ncbi:helix-turn-helix transcriptional regulator [Lysobacter korlensis]|uniref:Helix-turn-helix transcriptional regulator n=1 Tax=Lysobacter korlensis TaxID=553636 RepID=A0ABV6RNE8_9GAMM
MTESTTSRVLSLLNLLQTHRHWTGTELADRLRVTTRTLRRDVERLRDLGYRVESLPGAAGGYRLEAGSALPPLLLTDDEAVTMAIGLRVAATQGLTHGADTTLTALAKLEQVLPSGLRQRVNALAVTVQPLRPLYGSPNPPVSAELLGQLALACRDHERIRFGYVSGSGDETRRLVEPHALVSSDRAWFLVCWDVHRNDWRTFRADRMSDLFLTRAHFTPRELPAEDAAEFVAAAATSVPLPRNAEVVMRMPIGEMRAHFGPWARGAEPVGTDRTRWPIGGRSNEELLSALAWVPAGVEYEVRGDEEFTRFLRDTADRMVHALPA